MKEKNWIKTYIFDLLPLLTAMVYVVAILYNKAYFSVFGFNVINYISLSDMLMSVIELFIYVVVAIIIFVSVLYFETKLLYSILYSIIKRRKRGEAYLRLEKMNYSQCSKEIHIVLFSLFLIICLFYYFIFIHNKQPVDANSGLINAAKALSFPPLVFSFVISPIYIFLGKNAFIEKINNISSYKVISAIFIYFLYASLVMFKTGTYIGNYNLQHNQARFEIKTSEGTIFTDMRYQYVEQLHENYFLLEKKTGFIVVLSKSNLDYTIIDFQPTHKGLTPSMFEEILYIK